MKAYVFATQEACTLALLALNKAMRDVAIARGFTPVPPNGILGKNAETGRDEPSVIIASWADPRQTSDGQWFLPSCRVVFTRDWEAIEAAAGVTEVEASPLLVQTD